MKKSFLILLAGVLLTGCAKKNPADEELIKIYSESEKLSSYIEQTVSYDTAGDPDALMGSEHQCVQKVGLFDNRYLSKDMQPSVSIEVYENKQDAQIRYDYYSLINQCRKEFMEMNDLSIDGKKVFKEYPINLNGNVFMKTVDWMGPNVADAYFRVLDEHIAGNEYKQTGTISEEEYNSLHKKMVEDKKNTIENEIKLEAEKYSREADTEVADALAKLGNALDDSSLKKAESLIKEKYGAKYFDSLRKEWTAKLDELRTLKEEKDAAILAERDATVEDINTKLDEVESSADIALYEELEQKIESLKYDSLYSDYFKDWKKRMDEIKVKVDAERHKVAIQTFKDSCKEYSYKEFSRNSEDLKGTPVYFEGEVIQVVDQDSSGAQLRVNVTKEGNYYTYYTDTIYVEYDNSDEITTSKILEDDIIEIWGLAAGDVSYTSVLGSKVTIPAVYAKYIKVK